tara:strand:- start:141 stop:911 length:771 start_codon:yes stop_codon:yes gene_type:complete
MENQKANEIKAMLRSTLRLESRVASKRNDIDQGDVSPFFLSLIGEKITLYSKIAQSLQTTFGMSFYEQLCVKLAIEAGYEARSQFKLMGSVSPAIYEYMNSTLERTDYYPNRVQEIETIRRMSTKTANPVVLPDSTVDVFIKTPDGTEYLIDITTVKPNKKEFRALKRKLLTWAALRYSVDSAVNVQPMIAIPYNPEASNIESSEYNRFSAYYDRSDLLVGEELWRLVSGGEFGITDLTEIFTSLGHELRSEIESI